MRLTIKHVQEVTDFKDAKTAKAAIETLKWLEAGAPHKFNGFEGDFSFDMNNFLIKYNNTCGTTCCIAGAILFYRDDDLKACNWIHKGQTAMADEFTLYNDADENTNLYNLFFAEGSYKEDGLSSITPEEAAPVLRKYLETGVVDWSGV